MTNSGYTPCACRDCFEIAISNDVDHPERCHECETADCAVSSGRCDRPVDLLDLEDRDIAERRADERYADLRDNGQLDKP